MKYIKITLSLCIFASLPSFASEDHNMKEACKAECPSAKTEEDAHKCMKEVVSKKKDDRKFRKSDCYEAFREHEKHEKEEGHQH